MRRSVRKLTFVTDAPHFGGAERYIVAMARAAQRRGMEPHIHWMPLPGGCSDVFDTARAMDLHVSTGVPDRTRRLVDFVRDFRAMLTKERPDALVINACGRPRFWLTPWLSYQAGIPAVWVHQMVDSRDHRQLKPKWFGGRVEGLHCWRVPQAFRHRLAATVSTAVVTLNHDDRDRVVRWHGVPRSKIFVVPHGVDCEQYCFDADMQKQSRRTWGLPDLHTHQGFVVGTAGRLVAGKGIDLLIEATAFVRQRGIPMVTVIAGQGDERDALGQLAQARGVSDAVHFLEFVDAMPAFYSALDVFALCSDTESFGLVLAEAMACERPVVGTPTAGATRQIEHLRNGWQLSSFSPSELADALVCLYQDPTARKWMGQQGRSDVIQQFSIELTLERTLRALRGQERKRTGLCWPKMNEVPFVQMATEDLA